MIIGKIVIPVFSNFEEHHSNSKACDANQICTKTPEGLKCGCREGFSLDPLTGACQDINECEKETHHCSEMQRCENSLGSYQCIQSYFCGTGYTLNKETQKCEGTARLKLENFQDYSRTNFLSDDDECELGWYSCHDPYECYNTQGTLSSLNFHCKYLN